MVYDRVLHPSNRIHPTAVIGNNVIIGRDNFIGPFCYITNGTQIGDGNTFEAYCSIGTVAEHKDYFEEEVDNPVSIGDNNVFREFVTVNAGTTSPTVIKNDCILLRGSHVGHDSKIHNKVTLSCNVLVGGHTIIMKGVNMGLGSICHQYSVIGAYCMIGMGAIITKKATVSPGGIWVGNPAKYLRSNDIGLERNNISVSDLSKLTLIYDEYVGRNN